MYAVIASGGKQEKCEQGQQIQVELLHVEDGAEVSLTPVLVVDGATVLSTLSLPLQVDQERGVEGDASRHGSSGARSSRWACSRRSSTAESTGGSAAMASSKAPAVRGGSGQTARRITINTPYASAEPGAGARWRQGQRI